MSLSIGIVLAVILIVLLVLSKRSKETPERRHTPTSLAQSTTTRFHAVSIQTTTNGCEAAKSVEGKRFLSGSAPHLPLPECDAFVCKCRFVHHADRRSGVDRRGRVPPNVLASTGSYFGKERRFHERRGADEPRNFFA